MVFVGLPNDVTEEQTETVEELITTDQEPEEWFDAPESISVNNQVRSPRAFIEEVPDEEPDHHPLTGTLPNCSDGPVMEAVSQGQDENNLSSAAEASKYPRRGQDSSSEEVVDRLNESGINHLKRYKVEIGNDLLSSTSFRAEEESIKKSTPFWARSTTHYELAYQLDGDISSFGILSRLRKMAWHEREDLL